MVRLSFVVLVALGASPASAADAPDFNRDVRPILAARCFKCHGPDEGARKAKLRLDTRAGAEAVLGTAKDSELIRRITSTDADAVMPPPSTKVTLTAKEKDTLSAWVAAGGKYDPHCSFTAPKRPAGGNHAVFGAFDQQPAFFSSESGNAAPKTDGYSIDTVSIH